MMRARRIAASFVAAYGGAWAARIVIEIVDPGLTVMVVLFAIGTLGGAVIGFLGARDLEPWSPRQARDAVTGWGFVIAVALVLPVLLLPTPWRILGALAIGGLAVMAITKGRRAAEASALQRGSSASSA